MKGLVIKNTGSWYTVLTDDGQTVDCKIKGNFRLKGIRSTNPVAVGDRVTISPAGSSEAALQLLRKVKNGSDDSVQSPTPNPSLVRKGETCHPEGKGEKMVAFMFEQKMVL